MTYDVARVEERRLDKWDDPNYFMYRYDPGSGGSRHDATRWILDFKENQDGAVNLATEGVILYLSGNKPFYCANSSSISLVTIPSHEAHRPNIAGERLAEMVAAQIPWIVHLPNALERVTTVKKSARSGPGERPRYEDHYNSIDYTRGKVKSETVIMFDDVFTRGATSSACHDILKEAGFIQVFGLFLGKTIR